MKKIFTLACMACFAMSVNAQEAEVWTVASLDLDAINANGTPNTTATLKKVETQYNLAGGDQPTEEQVKADATAALELNDYIFTGATASIVFSGVSTPNTGTEAKDIWKFAGADNVKLNNVNLEGEELAVFDNQYVVAGNGNPSLATYEYFFTNSNGDPVGPRYYDDYWTPGTLPLKGCYYNIKADRAGKLVIGFFLNKNLNSNGLFIIDAATGQPLAQDKITIKAFRQNCNYEKEKGSATHLADYTLDENYLVQNELMASDTNRPLYGYVSFETEQWAAYYMLSPKSQMGVYGFSFTETTGINNVKNAAENANAPMYNLAGQQVEQGFKGMVIQNGKKFIVK